MGCANCNKPTDNPRFCSRSCAAQVTNRESVRRKKKDWNCERCGDACAARNKYCDDCRFPDYTKAEATYEAVPTATRFALIRRRAQVVVKDRPKVCVECGYSKHVEVCHVRAVKDFPPDARLSEINASSNLVLLCPNCHWEHDNLKPTKPF